MLRSPGISLPISGKLSITNSFKQSDFDSQGHLTIENKLKVDKSLTISKKAQLFGYTFFIVHKDTPAQIGEICLQKCLPISGKQTIANYLNQHDFSYQPMWP